MEDIFTIRLAQLNIRITSGYSYIRNFCRDYIIPDCVPDLDISAGDHRIMNDESQQMSPPDYLESLDIYRNIAEVLPLYRKTVFHGAVITYGDRAYLFTAPSGTGKTTHICLWRKYLGSSVDIINGDKPILSVETEQARKVIRAYGTPWAGKEHFQKNRSAVLDGICFIGRGAVNRIRRMAPSRCPELMMRQIYRPSGPESAGCMLEIMNDMLTTVPLWQLECDISEKAVKCSFEAMTGLKYPDASHQ